MPAVTSLAIPAWATKPRNVRNGSTNAIVFSKALTSGVAASADTIELFYLPGGARVMFASMRVNGSLGTGATIQLRHNGSAVTAATVAGGADMEIVTSNPGVATSGTTVELLVGTSAITASADVEVRLDYVV